jgi:uncharacterized spore protein YtfJ
MEIQPTNVPAFFNSLREGLEKSATVKTVYGDPVVTGTKTVIPVARIAWGFGGGIGKNEKRTAEGHGNEGAGGGAGIAAIPIGVVEVTPERTRFIPFGGTKRLAGTLVVGILLGMWIARRRRN